VIHSSSKKEKGTAEDFIFLTIGNGKEGIKSMHETISWQNEVKHNFSMGFQQDYILFR